VRKFLFEEPIASQLKKKFPRAQCNTKVHNFCHNSSLPVQIQSHINPVQSFQKIYLKSILILSLNLCIFLTSFLLHSSPLSRIFSGIRATCTAHLSLLVYITRKTFCEDETSRISSLFISPYSLVTSPPLTPICPSQHPIL